MLYCLSTEYTRYFLVMCCHRIIRRPKINDTILLNSAWTYFLLKWCCFVRCKDNSFVRHNQTTNVYGQKICIQPWFINPSTFGKVPNHFIIYIAKVIDWWSIDMKFTNIEKLCITSPCSKRQVTRISCIYHRFVEAQKIRYYYVYSIVALINCITVLFAKLSQCSKWNCILHLSKKMKCSEKVIWLLQLTVL